MNVSQRYWTQVRIDSGGDRRVTEIAPVKAFFKGQFSSLEPDVSNAFLQRHQEHPTFDETVNWRAVH
ncbi:hypothetical protein HPC62_11730 [Thermoleptolyngbya sichuanensis A183]|uniref:Uncharacterized protein n=1 Tax=Thermoleptolyngbya sichuanensis A183 TaxID=2737172 RepID=A0A6M8B6W1_9CYAN|nr:hypothetical protein [Thermoleptolyngbya sichuanensis]QKD82764.1 hypothetical protein HPC62_11730 [Thermoleptolyngbya sichuanensis A183]